MRHWRDARLSAVALFGLLLISCGGGSDTGQDASPPTIDISPQAVSLTVGGRQAFTVAVTGTTATSVTWSATGGTVTSSGQYTAPDAPGTYEVTAQLVSNPAVSATAAVTVNFSPVKAVTVIPSQVTLNPDAVQVFAAHVSGGSTPDVDWSMTPSDGSGGTITADGVYTAPSTIPLGPITVIATTRATPITSATATVTLTNAPVFSVEISDGTGQQGLESQLINGETRIFQARVSGASQIDATWSVTPLVQPAPDDPPLPSVAPTQNPLIANLTTSDRPGDYRLSVTVTDRITNLEVTAERLFHVVFISVTVTPGTGTLQAGGAAELHAAVHTDDGRGQITDDADSPDVTWKVQESNGGTVTPITGTSSNGAKYNAPVLAGVFHVIATHKTQEVLGFVVFTARSGSATVTVNAVKVAVAPSSASVRAGDSIELTATVSDTADANNPNNDRNYREVTWSIQEGSVGGTVTPNQFVSASGQSTATYLAPARVGSRAFHVIATSVADPSKKAVATITILGVWTAAAAGGDHTVAVKHDGTLWSWGHNADGQLGDGTQIDRLTPVQIGTDTDWTAVTAGARHTLALKNDGHLYAWGANDLGQLGAGAAGAFSSMPVEIIVGGAGGGWRMASARGDHSVALKTDGTLWAWGSNAYGEVGNGQSGEGAHQNGATQLTVTDQSGAAVSFEAVAAGTFHTLAIATDGTLWAWGRNDSGQLGDDSDIQRDVPTQIGIEADWIAIDAGAGHSAGVRGDRLTPTTGGTLWVWGDNSSAQLGDSTGMPSLIPLQVGTDTDWHNVYLGEEHTMASRIDQTLWGWGHNMHGELGLGSSGAAQVSVPTLLGGAISQRWLLVDSGLHHSAMLTADGHLWTTGSNRSGQIGDGSTPSKSAPARAGGASVGWQSAKLAAGEVHNAAIKIVGVTTPSTGLPGTPYGTLWTWGKNERGQLGDGTRADHDLPVQIGTTAVWSEVAVGALHTVALKTDGTLWTWGDNSQGQLGVGTQVESTSSPMEVPKRAAADPWVGIAAGAFHTVAITRNGKLWAWGANDKGQLGKVPSPTPPYPPEFLPVLVNSPLQPVAWVKVAAGQDHTLAVKMEVQGVEFVLWAWGENGFGQVGDGSFTDRVEPTRITLDAAAAALAPDWKSLSAGGQHSLGLKGAGELWGWGDNGFGQVDATAPTTVGAPTRVGSGVAWATVSAGASHTAGVAADGTLWTWGDNQFGQLGEDRNTDPSLQVGSETLWSSVSAGSGHTIATKTDGTLWAWGRNDAGQLGDGSAWRTSPTEIHPDSP